MAAYIDIIRWKNLLFIAFIQWLITHTVVAPILQTYDFDTLHYTFWGYWLIVATVLISAGGYVINDYYDVKIDRINKPNKIIVSEKISKKSAMLYYQLLTGLGVACGIILSLFVRSISLGFIFVLTPGLLWFYSASYKRQFLVGNLVVALLSSATIFVAGLLAVALLKTEYNELIYQTTIPTILYGWTGGFAFFAFTATWIREIIKDIEDEKGDREMECRTMVIKWGTQKTKLFLYGLILLVILSLFFVNYRFVYFEGTFTLRYLFFGLILPYIALSYSIFKAKVSADFHQASTFSKFIMLAGILYSLVFYYLQAKMYNLNFFGLFIIQ
ncbi:MAG: geranylgeranylglycerol-phosphate geranylgeranyltransferase [Paludibacteraceae bacterium]